MKIYVGTLAPNAVDADLLTAFKAHGTVESASVVKDKNTGASRGFGFVTMPDDAHARAAIAALNGKTIAGKAVVVNEAKSKTEKTAPAGK